jgi:hypothetical protein
VNRLFPGLAATATVVGVLVAAPGASSAIGSVDAGRIASAMSAAPAAISAHATIKDYPKEGSTEPRLLRSGSNGWTCLPDDTTTPGPDPMCYDTQTGHWIDAWLAHRTPHLTSTGYAYMLRGSSDASNTDPFATKPAPGDHWTTSPAHVMLFPTDPETLRSYPSSDPDNAGPWVMFPGTPYAHVMFPVTDR